MPAGPEHILLLLSMANSMGRRIFEGILEYANMHPNLRWRFQLALNQTTPGGPVPDEVSGVILQANNAAFLRALDRRGIPRVNVSSFLPDSSGPKVELDNRAIGAEAARHFIRRRFRNFAYLGVSGTAYSKLRKAAFAADIRASAQDARFFSTSIEPGPVYLDAPLPASVAEWIAKLPRPAALFAATDGLARQVIEVCESRGIRCPDEIAVLGVDNDEQEGAVSPVQLSSIALPFHSLGFHAAQLLAGSMRTRSGPARKSTPRPGNPLLPPLGIVTRHSTESLAVEEPVVARALHYIRDHSTADVPVEDIAAHCGVSRRYLERRFRSVLGHAPHAEVIRQRLHRVQLMLAETSLTVSEIADRLGYQEPKYLHRAFRREVGRSPMEYRRIFRR
ncbi:MAG: substrate-binding domain-containing protein [Opitutales bacterium]|nr:substrate-binding domain-containing protein [Opitutales bacterium]